MKKIIKHLESNNKYGVLVSSVGILLEKARKELEGLVKIKMLRRKRLKGKSSWSLNNTFSYIKPLREFLVGMGIIKSSDVAERLKKAGQIKLLIISGVFVHDFDSRVDLLVVGDKLKKRSLDSAIRGIEAEIGKELVYAVFDTADFQYRLSMYDKLIRDILDYRHEKIINKFGNLS